MNILDKLRRVTRLPPNSDTPSLIRAHALPGVVWIELTSRCPFDCVFCSRKLLRGKGQHMNFDLLKRLIKELGRPEIIRLNYSGESSHYPFIVEACELASATGARVELVTALASLPWHHVDRLARAGLSRLTVSLHTLDETRFQEIYRFSSIQEMRARIDRIVELSASATRPMEVDFAFVAMQRNLIDLQAIADYATSIGITRIDVHPVIRRDPIPETFDAELDGDRLRPSFLSDLDAALDTAKRRQPQITFGVSTPELMDYTPLLDEAHSHPWPLQGNAQIHGCEQDPWNTVHILAGGEVVTCEVRDQIVMGRLTEHSLADIWNSEAYISFRDDHFYARDDKCRACPYKVAASPKQAPSAVAAPHTGRAALAYGWHAHNQEPVFWSHPHARIVLYAEGQTLFRLRGLLPAGQDAPNTLTLKANGLTLETWTHDGTDMADIHLEKRLNVTGQVILEIRTSQPFNPRQRGTGDDSRDLGFALIEASLTDIANPKEAI